MFLLMNWCTRIVILVESFANNKILLFTSKIANRMKLLASQISWFCMLFQFPITCIHF